MNIADFPLQSDQRPRSPFLANLEMTNDPSRRSVNTCAFLGNNPEIGSGSCLDEFFDLSSVALSF